MIQEILALAIVFSAIFYTIYQAIQFFIPSIKKTNACNGMCSGCSISNIKNKNISLYRKSLDTKFKMFD